MNGFTLGFDNASGGVLHLPEKVRVTLLALGDVGSALLTGLRLMGGDVISSIGICDVRPGAAERWEFELNQIQLPGPYDALPPVEIVPPERHPQCPRCISSAAPAVPYSRTALSTTTARA